MFRLVLVIFTPVPDSFKPLYLRCNASNELVVYKFIQYNTHTLASDLHGLADQILVSFMPPLLSTTVHCCIMYHL
jgi:hypothetical protein